MSFKDFVFQFKLFRNQSFEWQKWSFRLENGWKFSSHGSRDFKKKIETHIHWSYPNKPLLEWVYRGELFKGQWRSQNSWVNQWLDENRDFLKKHPDLGD